MYQIFLPTCLFSTYTFINFQKKFPPANLFGLHVYSVPWSICIRAWENDGHLRKYFLVNYSTFIKKLENGLYYRYLTLGALAVILTCHAQFMVNKSFFSSYKYLLSSQSQWHNAISTIFQCKEVEFDLSSSFIW